MGNLSRKEFDLLNALISSKGKTSQRRLEELTGYSLSTVNRTMRELAAKELVDDQGITMHGLAAMEPYAAKRAVFVAAGFGSRMVVTGDLGQVDLPRGVTSGLREAAKVLEHVKGVGIVRLAPLDAVS